MFAVSNFQGQSEGNILKTPTADHFYFSATVARKPYHLKRVLKGIIVRQSENFTEPANHIIGIFDQVFVSNR